MDLNLDNVSEYFEDNTNVPEEFYENVVKVSNIQKIFKKKLVKDEYLKRE